MVGRIFGMERVAALRKGRTSGSSGSLRSPGYSSPQYAHYAPDSRAMANRTMYTRVYSERSVGKLVSGKGPNGAPLSDTALLDEFRNHSNKDNREPTALISGSDRIVDTLKRALDKHYKDRESLADIWIAFIEVPPTTNETATRIHSAKELAERCKLEKPNKFSHEVVFEWAIPKNYVAHEVSLQTLMGRGLQKHCFFKPSTIEVRRYNAKQLRHHDPWEIGLALGFFAQNFGARAPLNWISHQLFYDCVWSRIEGDDVVRLNYAHEEHIETVNFRFFCDLDDGIATGLCDWWLLDTDFRISCDLGNGIDTGLCDWWLSDIDSLDYEEFKEWRDVTEDSIAWELIEFWETWHDVDCDGITKELSAKERFLYDRAKNKLLAGHEKLSAAIEAEAVKIGL
ncbi:hypothetical protein V502_10865 [Pseudogymnoascus sp. VKM F-4520 (FW-2644)]|nr:hypothetical protein V502_10865 [Pseudogymnoascus sp. VKM F-4520 (FW-2644)]